MLRRSFLKGLAAAALASLARFYPVPEAPAVTVGTAGYGTFTVMLFSRGREVMRKSVGSIPAASGGRIEIPMLDATRDLGVVDWFGIEDGGGSMITGQVYHPQLVNDGDTVNLRIGFGDMSDDEVVASDWWQRQAEEQTRRNLERLGG